MVVKTSDGLVVRLRAIRAAGGHRELGGGACFGRWRCVVGHAWSRHSSDSECGGRFRRAEPFRHRGVGRRAQRKFAANRRRAEGSLMQTLLLRFRDGGWGMWPILVWAVFTIAIIL